MAKIQTRRTVSITRAPYEKARARATAEGIPLAQVVDQLIERWLAGEIHLAPARTTSQPVALWFDGRCQSIAAWAREIGISESGLRWRLGNQTVAQALMPGPREPVPATEQHLPTAGEKAPDVPQEPRSEPEPPVDPPIAQNAAQRQFRRAAPKGIEPHPQDPRRQFLPRGSCGSCGEVRNDRRRDPEQNNAPVCGSCRTVPPLAIDGPKSGGRAA